MRNGVKGFMPAFVKSTARELMYRLQGTIDLLTGKRTPLIPPVGLMNDGPRDYEVFKKNGQDFLKYYINLCGLQPEAAVLDVGCGMGRKTIPLITYLNENGRYEGLDINRDGITWCKKGIGRRHDNFRFQLIDVFNERYNPSGRGRASEYRFPFADGTFDFVVLGSVFTHMLPADMENYLAEVSRVLRPNGSCLITFFLLNEESHRLISDRKSSMDFKHKIGDHCYSEYSETPEQAIAYDESYIRDLYERVRLEVDSPINYGNWCQRATTRLNEYQDIIVARK